MNAANVATVGALAALLLAGLGCSEGGFGPGGDDVGVDDTRGGTGGDTGGSDDGDTGATTDSGSMEDPDGESDTGMDGPETPPGEAFTSCGAGGISSGDGVRAVQCYGPVEISGREASGGGVTWQSGAFRMISEGAQ